MRRPYTDEALDHAPWGVELRTDASDLASELVRHDHDHGTSTTGDIPSALDEDCTDADRDAVRAYVRREWIASQGRMS